MKPLSALWRRFVMILRRDRRGPVAPRSDRRDMLKVTATVGAAAASTLVLPKSWTKPVLRSIVVPAHAHTTEKPATTTEKPPRTTEKPTTTTTTAAPTTAAPTTQAPG